MNFRSLFPLVDFEDKYTFEKCQSHEEFLQEIITIYFNDTDPRIKEAALAVYMAYRDHYPSFISILKHQDIQKLDHSITTASPKINKLRRIVNGTISKKMAT